MRNISKDIKLALDTVIEGLEFEVDVDAIEPEKIKVSMEAKTDAFKTSKHMVTQWRNSRNAPNNDTLLIYIEKIVNAGDNSIVVLRKALRKQIDYGNLDEAKHRVAIQAKPLIVTAIYEIEAGLFELRHQLESGIISTEHEEFKVGYPEKFAAGEMLDVSKLFKKWDNTVDVVNICPHGSKGKIIEISDLKIQLPKPPRDRTKILFHDKKKADQCWSKLPLPEGLSKQTADQYVDYIYEEFNRRNEGVWFYNNGIPTYLTGDMYFALQWCRMLDDGKMMGFRYAQADIFYFLQACIVDPRCLGDWFEKSRRTGYTFIVLFTILNRVTMMKNQKAGITSKTEDDAADAFSKFSYAFLNLPFFFRPVVRGDVESKKKLEFGKPVDRSKQGKKRDSMGIEKYLNSIMDYKASVDGSYDSSQLNWYLCDESSKRFGGGHNIIRHIGQVTPTMKQGGRIVGKIFGGSTVAAKKKGGNDFKQIAETSNVADRDSITKRTPSNLYRHWIYAQENHENHIDKYGYCHQVKPQRATLNMFGYLITEGSTEYIQAEARAQRTKSNELYNEYLRANPLTRADMYRDESGGSSFNKVKIHEQAVFNSNIIVHPVIRGNFAWDNGNKDTKVIWIPNEKGKFYVTWLPPEDMQNKFVLRGNMRIPANSDLGRGGVDSYDIDQTVDDRGSNGACHFFNRGNLEGHPSNQFVLEYIERPPYAAVFYEDILMASVFYGYPLLIENNKYGIVRHFEQRGYRGYVLKRPKEYTPEGSRSTRQYGIPSNSQDIIQTHGQKIETYIHMHVGIWTQGDEEAARNNGGTGHRDIGDCGVCYHDRTIADWSDFDMKNRTKYDATVSSGLALMAADVAIRPVVEKYILKHKKIVRTYKKGQRHR